MGPRFSIVFFNTIPKLYCDTFSLIPSSELDLKNFFIPEVRILIAAEAKEENTLQHQHGEPNKDLFYQIAQIKAFA